MDKLKWAGLAALIGYVAVSFGKIAEKEGRNPYLYGALSVISPVNLVILGYWAFSKRPRSRAQRVLEQGRRVARGALKQTRGPRQRMAKAWK